MTLYVIMIKSKVKILITNNAVMIIDVKNNNANKVIDADLINS